MSLRSVIVGQFKRPHGLLGRLAGWIMATRPSNRQRNLWTVGLLDLQPRHRVLEIGCGPGLALKAAAEAVTEGSLLGLDHSEVMIAQAGKRLARELRSGRVSLRVGGLEAVPLDSPGFDRIFSLNVVQFFADLDEGFRTMHRALAAGGLVASTYQPRMKNPTREKALAMAERIEAAMTAAGFSGLERRELPLEPVPAICVLGVKS